MLPDFFNIDNGQSVTEMVKMTLMLLMTVWLLSNAAKKLTRPGFTKGYQIPSMLIILPTPIIRVISFYGCEEFQAKVYLL